MYVREGVGAWYNTLLDVAGEAGAAVAEAYGGKMAGDSVRAGHKIWTSLAFKDKAGGGGSAAAPPPPPPPSPPPRPIPRPMAASVRFAPGPPSRPGPSAAQFRTPPPLFRTPPNLPSAPMMTSAGIVGGGGGSKGLLIFGVLSAAAVGIYLLTQKKTRVPR